MIRLKKMIVVVLILLSSCSPLEVEKTSAALAVQTSTAAPTKAVETASTDEIIRAIDEYFDAGPQVVRMVETLVVFEKIEDYNDPAEREKRLYSLDEETGSILLYDAGSGRALTIIHQRGLVQDKEGNPKKLADGTTLESPLYMPFLVELDKATGMVGRTTPMLEIQGGNGMETGLYALIEDTATATTDTAASAPTLLAGSNTLTRTDPDKTTRTYRAAPTAQPSPTAEPPLAARRSELAGKIMTTSILAKSEEPIQWIEGEVETGVNLLDKEDNYRWAVTELAKRGETSEDVEALVDKYDMEGKTFSKASWGGLEKSILSTKNYNSDVILGMRTVELPGHPGGKLRCLMIVYPGYYSKEHRVDAVAIDAWTKEDGWALLLNGVQASTPSEVAMWVDANHFKVAEKIFLINSLSNPKYLEDPSWLKMLPGNEELRNRIIDTSYIGWKTRYSEFESGVPIRVLMEDIIQLNESEQRSDVCLFGENITMK